MDLPPSLTTLGLKIPKLKLARLAMAAIAVAVVAVWFVISLKAMDWLSPRAPLPKAAQTELPPLPPASRTSFVMAPVLISLSALRDAADRAAPRNFAGKADNPAAQ